MPAIRHSHPDYREPGKGRCRLSSACLACDEVQDTDAEYGDFPFMTQEESDRFLTSHIVVINVKL